MTYNAIHNICIATYGKEAGRMSKMEIDKDLLKHIKELNVVLQKGKLGKIQESAVRFRKRAGPSRKIAKYDCGQCVVCSVCLGTPTPDIEVAVVTGVVML